MKSTLNKGHNKVRKNSVSKGMGRVMKAVKAVEWTYLSTSGII